MAGYTYKGALADALELIQHSCDVLPPPEG